MTEPEPLTAEELGALMGLVRDRQREGLAYMYEVKLEPLFKKLDRLMWATQKSSTDSEEVVGARYLRRPRPNQS